MMFALYKAKDEGSATILAHRPGPSVTVHDSERIWQGARQRDPRYSSNTCSIPRSRHYRIYAKTCNDHLCPLDNRATGGGTVGMRTALGIHPAHSLTSSVGPTV